MEKRWGRDTSSGWPSSAATGRGGGFTDVAIVRLVVETVFLIPFDCFFALRTLVISVVAAVLERSCIVMMTLFLSVGAKFLIQILPSVHGAGSREVHGAQNVQSGNFLCILFRD